MAFDFNGTTQRLENAAHVLSPYPCTMACWFNTDDNTNAKALMSMGDPGVTDYVLLHCQGNAGGDPVRAYAANVGTPASTSTGFSTGTDHHACGVWGSATDRRVFIDGGSKGTNTSSNPVTPDASWVTYIGDIAWTSTRYFNGRIWDAAIWNVALSDSEVAQLAAGFCPLLIRPDALAAYWPLGGPYGSGDSNDLVGGFDLTQTNSPTFQESAATVLHYPSTPAVIVPVGAAPPVAADYATMLGCNF